jgi:hypothetical protein
VLSDSTVEELLLGMSSQIAEWEDTVLCSDVRDKLFGPMEFSRRDLGALNIMRGRDNGLPDYNTVRYVFFLQILVDFVLYLFMGPDSSVRLATMVSFLVEVGFLFSLPSLHCF